MRYLRYGTATRVTIGPFLDKTDGITPEVALTVTSCHLTLMADTAGVPTLVLDANATASAGDNDMVHVTGDDAGFYDLELTAAQLTYYGRAMLSINDVATHCPVFHEFMILPAQVYDSLALGSEVLSVNATSLGGVAQTGRDIGTSVLLSSGTGTGQISLSSGAVLLQATQTGVTIPTVTAVTTVNGIAANAITAAAIADGAIDAATFAAGAINAAAIATDAIDADALAADAIAEINATVDTALSDINLDHLCGTATGIPTLPADTWLDTIRDDGAYGDFSRTTDSLQALRDAAATVATVADAVWDEEITTGHVTANSSGAKLNAASAAGDPWAVTAMSSTYTTPDTAGYILANASGAVSGIGADTDEILTRLPDATAGAQNGLLIAGTNYGATFTNAVTMSGGLVANITGTLTGNIAGDLSGSVGSVTTVTDKTGYALSSGGNTAAADALLTRNMALVTEGSGRTPLQALRVLRNKWALAANTLTVYKEDDSASSWSATTTTTVMNPINSVDPV